MYNKMILFTTTNLLKVSEASWVPMTSCLWMQELQSAVKDGYDNVQGAR